MQLMELMQSVRQNVRGNCTSLSDFQAGRPSKVIKVAKHSSSYRLPLNSETLKQFANRQHILSWSITFDK